MVKTAQDLERDFRVVGQIRQGNPAYENDAGYWTGGTCNWGANHRLSEDCQTLAKGLNKVESLNGKTIQEELTHCTNQQEFEAKKSTLLMKADEVISGLRVRCGPSSSMFGICIIWAEQANNQMVEKEMELGRQELTSAKRIIEQTSYNWAEEIKELNAEIRKIEMGMEEKKQRATNEKDPILRAKIIEEIESDGRLLQSKLEKQNELTNRFRSIDPSKHVSRMIERMKKAIAGGGRSGGYGGGSDGGGNRRRPNEPNDPFGGGNWPSPDDGNIPNRTPRSRNIGQAEPGNNQQLILIVVAVAVVMFFMMRRESGSKYADYDY